MFRSLGFCLIYKFFRFKNASSLQTYTMPTDMAIMHRYIYSSIFFIAYCTSHNYAHSMTNNTLKNPGGRDLYIMYIEQIVNMFYISGVVVVIFKQQKKK